MRIALTQKSAWLADPRMPALLAITLAGFALRFVDIGKWPLWGDEALTLLVAQWPLRNLFLDPVDPTVEKINRARSQAARNQASG